MSASTDVESQSAARPRGRCLDTFLTVSVLALFVMFLVGLGGAVLYARHIESEMNARMPRQTNGHADARIAHIEPAEPGNSYKVQSFAYLRATNSELKTGVMEWEPIEYGEGHTIGALYNYEKDQRVLKVMASGSYFLYVQLNFSCVHVCKAVRFTVSFYDQNDNKKLTCPVSLPSQPDKSGSHPVSHTCWRVITLLDKESRLLAKADFSPPMKNWKLELNDSGFGMFLVDR